MPFYLDADTTPPLQGRHWHSKRIESAKRRALDLLAGTEITEGQIGLYEHSHGGKFYGYAIKHAGEAPFFEEPPTDEAAPSAEPVTATSNQEATTNDND